MNQLKIVIQTIKNPQAPRTQIKAELMELEKIIYSYEAKKKLRKKSDILEKLLKQEAEKLAELPDLDRQVALISCLRIMFWVIQDNDYLYWASFLLDNLQHQSGKIRQATYFAFDIFMMQVTLNLNHFSRKPLTKEKQDQEIEALIRFGTMTMEVERLIADYEEPRFKKYKYISSLPVSIYKTLQKILMEVLLRSDYYIRQYNFFLFHIHKNLKESGMIETVDESDWLRGKKIIKE